MKEPIPEDEPPKWDWTEVWKMSVEGYKKDIEEFEEKVLQDILKEPEP